MASQSKLTMPKDGLAGLKENWKFDLTAGFVLFLLALPLSVGIAIASGMPATAGILAAIIGGVLGSLMGGSYVTINGPAAGLIVIVLAAVTELGAGDASAGFHIALAAITIAGALQVVMGFAKLGGLGLAFPTSVIHGMLMSIGVIIFAKQFHVALGVVPTSKSIFGLLGEIPNSFGHLNPEIGLIGLGSFALLVGWTYLKGPWAKIVPGPLVAVVFGILAGRFFDIDHEHMVKAFMGQRAMKVGPSFLLSVPEHIRDAIYFPDFSLVKTGLFWRHTITIALVATIESVLSCYAVDKLDPFRRVSNLNRDLWSKGFCNMLSGSVGGLPMIAEIVRSSANVTNGARTRWSCFFHGVFILVFVSLFPTFLHHIPLASLAAVLVVVGYRLGNPKQLTHAWKMGWDQLLVMGTTLLVTLGTDLLVGVATGFVLEMALNVVRARAFVSLFTPRWKRQRVGSKEVFKLSTPLVSTGFVRLRSELNQVVGSQAVVVDLSECRFVDHTTLEHLEYFGSEAKARGTTFETVFSKSHVGESAHPLAGRKLARVGR